MTVTEQDIRALTPHNRIVWRRPPGRPVEMGLYVDDYGGLCTDAGHTIRYPDDSVVASARDRIVRIIPPAFVPRAGMVIGNPDHTGHRLVRFEDATWLGAAPDRLEGWYWFSDDDARTLIEDHGWEVMGDLSAPGEVTDAEVEAFRVWLDSNLDITDEVIRSGLEAARRARNG